MSCTIYHFHSWYCFSRITKQIKYLHLIFLLQYAISNPINKFNWVFDSIYTHFNTGPINKNIFYYTHKKYIVKATKIFFKQTVMQKKKTTSPYLSPLFSSIFLPHKYRSLPLFLPLYQSHSRTRCSRKMQWNPHNTHKNKNFIENYQCYVGFVNDNEANGKFFSPIYKYKNNPFRNFSKDYFPRTHFFIYTQTVNTHKQTNKYHPQTLFCNKYEDFQCKQTHTHLMQIHINTGLLFTTTEFFCYFFFVALHLSSFRSFTQFIPLW